MHIEKDYKRQVVQIMEKLNSFYKMLKNNAEKYPNKEAIIYDNPTCKACLQMPHHMHKPVKHCYYII